MKEAAEKRGQLIQKLEEALTMTEELNDPTTGYLIERALDEARSQQFRPPTTA
jgi:DNA-binding ferritin-like protein